MEMILFIGIQATGKSSFYLERFFRTHVRISLDMPKTRHREQLLLKACLEGKTPVVVDKMNLTKADRAAYIGPAKAAGFKGCSYLLNPTSLARCNGMPAGIRPSACRKLG